MLGINDTEKDGMPKSTAHALIWSPENTCYELYTHGQLVQRFGPGDEEPWLNWLNSQISFSFQGRTGRLNLLKEVRPRGAGYWYAYHYTGQRTVKRYLGRTATLAIPRLEDGARILTSQNPPPSSTSEQKKQVAVAAPLLVPKICSPRLPLSLIERSRLLDQLDAGLQHPLTLIAAPAGFGKTTLVGQWIASRAAVPQFPAVAWVSLETEDNDPVRFWRYVMTACQTFQTRPGQSSLEVLSLSQQPSFEEVLTPWLNELALLPDRGLLILDDYHVIIEPGIHAAMTFFVNHLPATLHLVLLSRSEPPLPLLRWHARGSIQTIQATALRFSASETASFLRQELVHPLSEEVIRRLNTRLEGWPVGLRLLVLTLQGHRGPQEIEQHLARLSGGQLPILDYFISEVLVSQPEPIRQFLFQTSMLGRLTGALCNAVTGRQDSEEVLVMMERTGLFLTAQDGDRQWYRYHALFAEAMYAEARRRLGDSALRTLSIKASEWYEQQALLSEAVEAALRARAFARAANLIERCIDPESLRNEYQTLCRWLGQLPEEVMQARSELSFMHALAIMFTSDRRTPASWARIEAPLQQAEQGFQTKAQWERLGEALELRAELTFFQDDFASALALARQARPLLSEQSLLRGTNVLMKGIEKLLAGEMDVAWQCFLEGGRICESIGSFPATLAASILLGETCYGKGDLRLATRYYHQALARSDATQEIFQQQLMTAAGVRDPFFEVWAWQNLATLAYEWNELDAARQYLSQAQAVGENRVGAIHLLTPCSLIQAHLLYRCGETTQALELLGQWERQVRWPWSLRAIYACQARLHLALGDLAAVEQWSQAKEAAFVSLAREQDKDLPLVRQEEEALLQARLYIAQEKAEDALQELALWKGKVQAQGRKHALVEILMLEALAYFAGRELTQARTHLIQSLKLARPENYQRLFLDEGQALEALLKVTMVEIQEKPLVAYARSLLHAFAQEQAVASALTTEKASGPFEPLTQQEQRVLRLLVTGRSNSEIARTLGVSVNTAKTHVKNLYSKLNVNNRMQASALADHLHLL